MASFFTKTDNAAVRLMISQRQKLFLRHPKTRKSPRVIYFIFLFPLPHKQIPSAASVIAVAYRRRCDPVFHRSKDESFRQLHPVEFLSQSDCQKRNLCRFSKLPERAFRIDQRPEPFFRTAVCAESERPQTDTVHTAYLWQLLVFHQLI